MEQINPLLDRAISAVAVQTQPSTSTSLGKPSYEPTVPAAVKKLIGELGMRYRPSAQADLAAHSAALALLCRDLWDVPATYLASAINQWVATKPWMPKASELVELARNAVPRPAGLDGRTLADRYNARLDADPNGRRDIRWVDLPDGGVKIEHLNDRIWEGERCTPEQAAEVMAEYRVRG